MPLTQRQPLSSSAPGPRPGRSVTPLAAPAADVLRIVCDPHTAVFVTALPGGRLRYGYWRQAGSTGGSYAALPTDVCEELRAAGRITLGTPVVDPGKTTYRVSVACTLPRADRARAA